jgi:cytochrome c oxidase subunit IV
VSSVRKAIQSLPERTRRASIAGTIDVVQPQDPSAPHWSPDRLWWWDGGRWVPAAQAPMPPPPAYYQMPPPIDLKPSPGLRPFLIVFLIIDAVVFGLLTLVGGLAEVSDFNEGQGDVGGVVFWSVIAVVFVLAVVAVVGVFMRTAWARWVALAAGVAVCFTCIGTVLGVPIIVSAARAPLGKPAAAI